MSEDQLQFENWLAGLIDGEGTFYLARRRARFSLGLRDDDAAALQMIHSRTELGDLWPTRARPPSHDGVVWDVHRKADVLRLCTILDRAPLRAKKARDYATWREGVRIWVALGRRRQASEEYAMERLASDLRRTRRYTGRSSGTPETESYDTDQVGFENWLAGFVDAEGSFGLSPSRSSGRRALFRLKLRDDDTAILNEIRRRTGLGCVSFPRPYPGERGRAIWAVHRKTEVIALCTILDRAPLRAKKARDYAVWREAVHIWSTVTYTNGWHPDSNCGSRLLMGQLGDELQRVRRYEGTTT